MTEKTFKSLLYKLNKNQPNELIFIRPLSETVDYAKVWLKKPKLTDNTIHKSGPNNFYFIKNDKGFYVATVLDMGNDLHWFVSPRYRKQGHLTKALRERILYHIFDIQDRDEQRITISEFEIGNKNFKDSLSVALKLGFTKSLDTDDFILTADNYLNGIDNEGLNSTMSEERMKELQKRVNYLSRSLWVIQSELEMKLGVSEQTDELKQFVDELWSKMWRIEDAWWDSKNEKLD
jgi:hypothetical protein